MCGARYRDLHTWARALHPLTQLPAHLSVSDECWLSTLLMYDAGTRRRRRHYFSLPCSFFRAQY